MKLKFSKSISAIVVLFIGLCVSLGFLARAAFQNWALKEESKSLASQLGFMAARENYVRGRYLLLEVKPFIWPKDGTVPDDGALAPTGRQEGRFEIVSLLVNAEFPAPHLKIQQTYVDAYNQRMRQFFENPEWFDAHGFRIPSKTRSHNATNAPAGTSVL